ncbi:hypothetical protein KGQ64_10660 [bacterium]|nr:hypothetical protein [bacterium]
MSTSPGPCQRAALRSARGAILLSLVAAVAACGNGGSPAAPLSAGPTPTPDPCANTTFASTWEAIQTQVFERHSCTTDACHGSGRAGNLDLRADVAHANLFDVPSAERPSIQRIRPGEPKASYLYTKLAASTLADSGGAPGAEPIVGSPMPSGLPAITKDELEALRIWIEAGAPPTGSIGDSIRGDADYVGKLLGACLPPSELVSIRPLDPPAAGEGVQFRMPTFVLPASTEREVCFAQYYDFSDQVPEELQDRARGVFYANGSHLRQDPGSHHLVLQHSGLGADRVHDPSFGAWTCKGGNKDGQACEPTERGACGAGGECGSEVKDVVACIGFGPSDGTVNPTGDSIGGAQTAQQIQPPSPDGFYTEVPIRGILYWNSHAFNLTTKDHELAVRLNMSFARDRTWPIRSVTDVHAIYDQHGQPPFTTKRYCADHTFPEGAEVLSLNSHTHKRGRNFTIDLPSGERIYESFDYSDPVNRFYTPAILLDSPDPVQRTLRYCADFNNGLLEDGSPDLRLVTRLSTMPDRTTCKPVACVAGRIGEPCAGADDDAACDSSPGAGDGWCDACPLTPGSTTENEMFVLTGTYVLRRP